MHRSAMNNVFVRHGACRQCEGDNLQHLFNAATKSLILKDVRIKGTDALLKVN